MADPIFVRDSKHGNNVGTTGESFTIAATDAGSFLVASFAIKDSVDTITSLTGGGTWTKIKDTGSGEPASTRTEIWLCLNPSAGTTTLTVAFVSSTRYAVGVMEWNPNGNTIAFDSAAGASAAQTNATASTTPGPGSFTPSQANGIAIIAVTFANTTTVVTGNPTNFTRPTNGNYESGAASGSGIEGAHAYRINPGTSAINGTFTIDVARAYGALGVFLKATPSGPATFSRTVTASAAVRSTLSRTITASATLRATRERTTTASAALRATLSRTVGTSAVLSAVPSRTAPASATLLSTQMRTAPASAALTITRDRTVTTSAALLFQGMRTVPASANLSGAATRTTPTSAALLAQLTRTAPASTAVRSTIVRSVGVTAALSLTLTRTAPASAALRAELARTAPASAALLAIHVRTIPASAAIILAVARTAPASAALLAQLSRTVSSSVALQSQAIRTVPAEAALSGGVVVVPVSDVSAGGWTPSTGSVLYAMIDETTVDDSDYITSSLSPSGDVALVRMQGVGDPNRSTGHILRVRYRKPATGRREDLTVELRQGATVIATRTYTDIGTSGVTAVETLSAAEADAITDYGNLRLAFIATEVT